MRGDGRPGLGGAIAVLLFTLLLWLYPLSTLRLPHQNDTWIHLRWADQFYTALQEGWLLPRWAHASISGLGDPTFFYYQPLFYYVSSAFSWLGLRSEYALLFAAMTPFLLLGWIVYFCFLGRYRNRNAILGALFVLACPILYFLSTYMASFPWTLSLPFSVLFVAESTRQQPRTLRLGVLLCLVCLSHLLSGMIALFCTGLGRLLLAFPSRRNLASHVNWALGVALGLGLAAFFIYPAISQLHLINPGGWTDNPGLDWRRAFAFPTFSYARYGFRWFAIQWPLALIALTLCLMVLMRANREGRTPGQALARRLAVVALCALALGSELAYPLYALLSPLQKVQFPYRFVFLALLLANLAFVIYLNERAWFHWGRVARTAAVALVTAQCAIAGYLQWSLISSGERMPERRVFMTGNFGQPEYIPAVSGPDWNAYVENGKLAGECERLAIRCSNVLQRSHAFSVAIDTPRAVSVRLPIFAFPAWSVSVDGKPQALVPDPATGLALVRLEAGSHRVVMTWSRMPAEILGVRITLGALGILLGALAVAGWRQRQARARGVLAAPAMELR